MHSNLVIGSPTSLGRTTGANALLKAKGLRKSFGGQTVLDDVDLCLYPGEVVLLRGENGSGKTTLLNILTGNLAPDAGDIEYTIQGRRHFFRFPGTWRDSQLSRYSPEFVANCGLVRTWQDIRLFKSLNLRDNIAVAPRNRFGENPLCALLGLYQKDLELLAKKMMATVNLQDREASNCDRISLGQAKRISVVRAVATGAKVLFLDEPLAGLDLAGIEEVRSLLTLLVEQHGLTVVIVEHAFNHIELRSLITSAWDLRDGTLDHRGQNAIQGQATCRTGNWFRMLANAATSTVEENLPRGAKLIRFRIAAGPQPTSPVLSVKNLVVRRGARSVIGLDEQGIESGFNLQLHVGEIAVLLAPNGWGKSTLVNALSGTEPVCAGEVRLGTRDLRAIRYWERAQMGLRVLSSDLRTFPSLTVSEVHKLAGTMNGDSHQRVDQLSGGQRRALSLDIIPWDSARLVVLDEPFLGLDSAAIEVSVAKIIARCQSTSDSKPVLILTPVRG